LRSCSAAPLASSSSTASRRMRFWPCQALPEWGAARRPSSRSARSDQDRRVDRHGQLRRPGQSDGERRPGFPRLHDAVLAPRRFYLEAFGAHSAVWVARRSPEPASSGLRSREAAGPADRLEREPAAAGHPVEGTPLAILNGRRACARASRPRGRRVATCLCARE
jgi:hypothetical protein